jgi:alkylation response protein AidB-like acyl-CoA dehydrogenase
LRLDAGANFESIGYFSRAHVVGTFVVAGDLDMDEQHSREVAEDARQKRWEGRGFLRELFLGNFRLDWIDGLEPGAIGADAAEFHRRFDAFMRTEVDSATIDEQGQYPPDVIEGLKRLGAFGMKIPKQYGGLGFNQLEYSRALEIGGRYDANIVALLSAHQSIGVPQPLKLFGTEAQKEKYLPRCARGAISAFALTEVDVGSDPATVATRAERTAEGDYILNGEKLWCTNGTAAELLVVMARTGDGRKISAFVVETNWPGVEVGPRCHFMGLRALENGVIRFKDVRVPKANLIGNEGAGLRIALVTLNTGRLGLPAACVGVAKLCSEIVREWSNARVQWGKSIGQHEAVAHKIAEITSSTYALEAMSDLCCELAMQQGYDIRLEAAVAKEWGTVRAWRIVDETLQIRGGRGYETEHSLRARGEAPVPVERMLRDGRINLIFEGSSEIMHLFIAREAVDKHLSIAGDLIDPKKTLWQKLRALPAIAFFYAWWYPSRWLGWGFWPRYAGFGRLAPYLRFCDRASRKLARAVFHGMLVHGPGLEKRQGFLFRLVDVANELFAMTSALTRAARLQRSGDPHAESAFELAVRFSEGSQRLIARRFSELWHNDDARAYRFAQSVLAGEHQWLEATRLASPEREPATAPERERAA